MNVAVENSFMMKVDNSAAGVVLQMRYFPGFVASNYKIESLPTGLPEATLIGKLDGVPVNDRECTDIRSSILSILDWCLEDVDSEILYKMVPYKAIVVRGCQYEVEIVSDRTNAPVEGIANLFHLLYPTENYSYAYDVTIAHYYCMKHAEQHGYNRILILENDNVFLKNKSAISNILDIAMEKCDDNGFIFCGAAGHAIYDYENEYHRNTLYQCTKEIDYDIIKLENDINTCGGASFNIYDKKAYTTFTKYIENGNYWTIDVYKNIYNLNEISIYFSNTYIAVQESWFGIFINALYNYNVNPNYKDKYLNICVGDYNSILDHALDHPNDIESDIWAHHIVFDQINEILFNNSLDKSKYINRDNLII